MAAEAAALQQLLALGGSAQQRTPPPVPAPYRSREPTAFRGVTRTSGTNSGLQKFDVQFVFCDNGTKKHPKIYGFASLDAAARAFDILTCKRALEKGRTVAGVLSAGSALGTNHPASDYADRELLDFLATTSRDDCIYGLKQCAKKGHGLQPGMLLAELKAGIEMAQTEAGEKRRMGDPRQSYEATAKGAERKRRSGPGASSGPGANAANQAAANQAAASQAAANAAAAAVAAAGNFQPPAAMLAAAAAAAAAAAMGQQPFGMYPGAGDGGHAAATLAASDIVGQFVRSHTAAATAPPPPPLPPTAATFAAMAAVAAAANTVQASQEAPAAAMMDVDERGGAGANGTAAASEDRSRTPTEGGMAGMPADEPGRAAAADGAGATEAPMAGVGDVGEMAYPPDEAAYDAAAAAVAALAPTNGRDDVSPTAQGGTPTADGMAAATAAAMAAAAAASAQQQQQQQQQQHLLLAQLLQSQMAAAAAGTQAGVAGRLASQGLPLLLEMLRLSAVSSQEISCAHDIVRIWAAVQQGQNWAAEQCHLPRQYYSGLLPVLHACPDTASILALTSQLWQSGMLRMLCNAYTASLQQQASALAMLQGASSNGAAAAAGLNQLSSLLAAATGGLAGGLPGASNGIVGDAAAMAAMASVLQNPGMAQMLGQAAATAGGGGQPPPMPAPTAQPAAPLPPPPAPIVTQRPQRQAAARGLRLSRQPSADPPAAKRPRRGGGGDRGSEEPPPPPQLQQLLDILSGENPSPRPPPQQQQQQNNEGWDEEMADAAPAPVNAAFKQEPAELSPGRAAQTPPQLPSAPAVSAFAAATQAQPLPGLAAAGPLPDLAPHQRTLSMQRSLSSHLPLPANQPNVRIVPAAGSRDPSGDHGAAAAAAVANHMKAHQRPGGGTSIELTITAPPPLQHCTPFGGPSVRKGATITTGVNRPTTTIAPPITTGTGAAPGTVTAAPAGGAAPPRVSSAAAAPAGTAAAAAANDVAGSGSSAPAPPMVSAFAAAAGTLPPIPAPPPRVPAGKARLAPQRTLSTPATITTGMPAGSNAARGSAAGLTPLPSGGLDVLSRAASLQQPSSDSGRPAAAAAAAPVGASAAGQEPVRNNSSGTYASGTAQPPALAAEALAEAPAAAPAPGAEQEAAEPSAAAAEPEQDPAAAAEAAAEPEQVPPAEAAAAPAEAAPAAAAEPAAGPAKKKSPGNKKGSPGDKKGSPGDKKGSPGDKKGSAGVKKSGPGEKKSPGTKADKKAK